ncbi:MAG: 16S rRNA (cytosine(967)-C(5))-methyltransferase RsmB [Lachnospiraceae bacterium]|nr:16S rRNA (cytosine(967)-C(5))-methyltransferase RsmB [Lachnospiraceae bacterium]
MTDVRHIAYEALLTAENDRIPASSKDVLEKYSYLDVKDRRFLKRIIEGTIERRITIDHVLDLYSTVPVRKMKKQVRTLLRMGVYQLLYMDSVKDFAAVNETVKAAYSTPARGLSGFINGVLRKVAANKDSIKWPDKDKDHVRYLSVMYSCPEWIVTKLTDEQGSENAETLLALSVSTRPVTARINLSKTTAEEVIKSCNAARSNLLDEAVMLRDYDNITDIPAFYSGSICTQDISSMLVCHLAGIKRDDTVLDLCASPGGKSLHAADIAVEGRVISKDVSEKKLESIRQNVERCGFTNIEISEGDATVYDSSLEGSSDVVIADVPCSGLGVMGRKNDIKYNLTPERIKDLVILQRRILKNASRYVKRGGILMFSTCTCSLEENQGNVEYLLGECGLAPVDFYEDLPKALRCENAKSGYIQLYGGELATDGFFIAKFRRG